MSLQCCFSAITRKQFQNSF